MKGPQILDYMYIYALTFNIFTFRLFSYVKKKGGDVVMSSLGPDPHGQKGTDIVTVCIMADY